MNIFRRFWRWLWCELTHSAGVWIDKDNWVHCSECDRKWHLFD